MREYCPAADPCAKRCILTYLPVALVTFLVKVGSKILTAIALMIIKVQAITRSTLGTTLKAKQSTISIKAESRIKTQPVKAISNFQ